MELGKRRIKTNEWTEKKSKQVKGAKQKVIPNENTNAIYALPFLECLISISSESSWKPKSLASERGHFGTKLKKN